MKSAYGKYFVKMALVWTVCFVLFLIIYMLVLSPQVEFRKQLEKQLADKKQTYDSALKAAQKETIIQLNEEIEQLRNKLKAFAIDFEDSANVTFDISQIANDKKVNSFSIETKKVRQAKKKKKKSVEYISKSQINISFTTEDFNQFASLLNALERHEPVIFVDKFAITRAGKGASEHKVKMNLAVFVSKARSS